MKTGAGIIKISLHALGGQGGSVLTNWIVQLAEREGYYAQSTSVPGVAQRTGATVYYIEIAPIRPDRAAPIFALMPVPGDVDIVLASEIIEAGRAVNRGLITSQTCVITSSHRVFAISEKSALGEGRVAQNDIWLTLDQNAAAIFHCDMQAVADQSKSVISAAMFGGLAASQALPFSASAFEETIRESGRAVDANLACFRAAMAASQNGRENQSVSQMQHSQLTQIKGTAKPYAELGREKCRDYQGRAYEGLYEDRLKRIAHLEETHYRKDQGGKLTIEVARQLANWMCYEDMIRISDLKIRTSRKHAIRAQVKAREDQIICVTEYLHPRKEEILDILPDRLVRQPWFKTIVSALLAPLTRRGRHVQTTNILPFFMLFVIAQLRPIRPISHKYHLEQKAIENWLGLVADVLPHNYARAFEIARLPRLRKGYGETFARGVSRFDAIIDQIITQPDQTADAIARLHDLALDGESNADFFAALNTPANQSLVGNQ